MPILSLLGENHYIPLFHMAKFLIWLNETKQRIPRRNKRRKTSDTLIIRKEPIKEPVNPSKRGE